MTTPLPSLFVAGGAPEDVGEAIAYARFMRRLGGLLPRPQAVVAISSSWESALQQVGPALRPALGSGMESSGGETLGLGSAQGSVQGSAQGGLALIDAALPLEIARLLEQEGIACELDEARVLDDSIIELLTLLFPAAELPVVALSVNPKRAPEEHYRIGQALAELRRQGVLVVGCGSGAFGRELPAGESDEASRAGGANGGSGASRMGSASGGERESYYGGEWKEGREGAESEHGSADASQTGSADWGERESHYGGHRDEGMSAALVSRLLHEPRFDEWLAEQLETWNLTALFACERRAPGSGEVLPASGRWAALLLAMGTADAEPRALRLYRSDCFDPLGPGCWGFGAGERLTSELEMAFGSEAGDEENGGARELDTEEDDGD
ncbi:hypothetical protein B5M42_021190 [Paenibacillus athensensis]|uniref:dioxygenase family protein n=1 Tax=Paenibacillus athensensis TaxID=1967502 RepID=UPI001431C23C|nr:hypothetical protein [Paenibacillus athensensis]MCD1261319.1 hypothetical protein [Paenibacillus athensensis]